MKGFSLVKATEEHITRKRFKGGGGVHFYPSEASVKIVDSFGDTVVHGTCLRQSFFRCMGEESGSHSARSEFIFELGKSVEKILINLWKEMGIWVANNVKFYDRENNISGELDVVLKDPEGKSFCTEVKSFYGFLADKEILGGKGQSGRPKMNQLLQAIVYAHQFKSRLDYVKMFYMNRGDAGRTEFDVRVLPDDLGGNGDIIHRPEVDGKVMMEFTVEDIYMRYAELAKAIRTGKAPDKDFELYYSDEKIEDLYKKKKLSKTKYDKFRKKGIRPGDWNCSYCSGYKHLCWGK